MSLLTVFLKTSEEVARVCNQYFYITLLECYIKGQLHLITSEKATKCTQKQKMHKTKHLRWIIHTILSYMYYKQNVLL